MADSSGNEQTLDLLGVADTVNLDVSVQGDAPDVGQAGANEAVPGPAATVQLNIEDLLPDADGNVVIFDEAGLTEMAVVGNSQVVDHGIVDGASMVGGMDVSGMAYYAFDSGVTLYLPHDIHLSILSA